MAFGSSNSSISPSTTSSTAKETTPVQVALRVRPLNSQDRAQPRFSQSTDSDVIKTFDTTVNVVPHQKAFTFDHVFGTNSTQEQVFSSVASKLVDRFIDGYNVTILAYGQTSSGKTYTMGTEVSDHPHPDHQGIIPRAMAALFQELYSDPTSSSSSTSRTSSPLSSTPKISKRHSSNAVNNNSNLKAPSRLMRPSSMLTPPSNLSRRASFSVEQQQQRQQPANRRFSVKVSFVEIYNEDLVDLLNPAPADEKPPVTIREDTKGQIYWTGVKEVPVDSTEDVLRYLQMGTQNRATGSTDMNAKSSRSHAIFSVTLRQEKWIVTPKASVSTMSTSQQRPPTPTSSRSSMMLGRRSSGVNVKAMVQELQHTNPNSDDGKWVVSHSKFHFVDLAGSERLKRTAAEGDRRKEGININAGLLALGNVISALADSTSNKRPAHIPYRDSKLTRLLQDSLGGNATTLMIACISPAEINLVETVNTIKYAHRARNIKNRVERNEAEEWLTNDNPEFLRGIISKLKGEVRNLKSSSSTSTANSSNNTPTFSKSTDSSTIMTPTLSSSATTQLTVPEVDSITVEQQQQQQQLVTDLRKQIGDLQVALHKQKDLDFQHLVEPVIEEYEKSVSSLESQLAMARAALATQDQALADQQHRLTELDAMRQSAVDKLQQHEQQQQQVDVYEKQLQSCRQQAKQLEEQARGYEDKIRDYEQQLQMAEEHKRKHAQEIEECETRLRATQDEAARQQSDKAQWYEQQVHEYEQQLQMFQSQQGDNNNEKHQEALGQLKQQIDEYERRMAEYRAKIAKCEQQLNESLVHASKFEVESIQLGDKLRQMDEHRAELQQASQSYESQANALQLQLTATQEQLQHADQKLQVQSERYQHESNQWQQQVNDLARQLEEITALRDDAIDIRDSQAQEITRLEACLRQELQQRDARHADIMNHQRKLHRQRLDELESAHRDAKTLQLVQHKQEAIIHALESKVDALEQLVSNLQKQLDDRDQQIAQFTHVVQHVLDEVHTVGSERQDLERLAASLGDSIHDHNIQADNTLAAVKELEAQRHQQQDTEDDGLEIRILELEQQSESAIKKIQALECAKQQLENELDKAKKLNMDQENIIASLETSLQAMQTRLEEAVASHTQKSELIQSLQEQLNQRRRLMIDTRMNRDSGLPDEHRMSADSIASKKKSITTMHSESLPPPPASPSRTSHSSCSGNSSSEEDEEDLAVTPPDNGSELSNLDKLQDRYRRKLTSAEGQEELLGKLMQLMEENSQLSVQVNELEAQMILQHNQLTLESKNLELKVMKLAAANERLEKEVEQAMIIPRSTSSTSSNNNNTTATNRDSILFSTSPPQTPRSPPNTLHQKLQRDWSLFSLKKSGSMKSILDQPLSPSSPDEVMLVSPTNTAKRGSAPSTMTAIREQQQRVSNTTTTDAGSPPPSAPPSNPLPPVPSPARSVSTPLLQRQTSSGSTAISDLFSNGGHFTSEQYEKIIRSLQRKMNVADEDVRAHQQVIGKLETQLSRSENAVRSIKRQLDTLNQEKQTYILELEHLRSQQNGWHEEENVERTRLIEELENERMLKDKAERARTILEHRMEKLMCKRNKFMCF
ncbi:kinesin-domain-containing protein [Lichtheimia hyalospora FSU 10163]|nr:kinesin-domain-containing protein [Lichtheimia hyalospora FSU 10163]